MLLQAQEVSLRIRLLVTLLVVELVQLHLNSVTLVLVLRTYEHVQNSDSKVLGQNFFVGMSACLVGRQHLHVVLAKQLQFDDAYFNSS